METSNDVTVLVNGLEMIINKEILQKIPYFVENNLTNSNRISLQEVNSDSMGIIVKYLEHYKNNQTTNKIPEILFNSDLKAQLNTFDYELIAFMTWEEVFHLINAAAFLKIDHLHDLACAKVAAFMKDKAVDEINKHFTFECQLTTEEAKELGLDIDDSA